MANELILVVEDNDKNRKLVRDVLTFKGYEIIEAETGEEVERKATLTPAGARRAAGHAGQHAGRPLKRR